MTPLPRLQVSSTGHYLVTEQCEPFFWLGDTAWRMIQRAVLSDNSDQPSASLYFEARRSQGFNVVQTVAARHGAVVNAEGHPAFHEGDFTRPRVVDGPGNDYWDLCDALLDLSQANGFYVALLPLWLNAIDENDPILRDPSIAYRYGRFLGHRYNQRTHLIWVMGGDPSYRQGRDVNRPERLALVRALAEGVADGTNNHGTYDGKADWSSTLMTYHPRGGGYSSSLHLHREAWMDFNMVQTTTLFDFANYRTIAADVARRPPKPTLDAEVAYEGSLSLSKKEPQNRRIAPWDVRRAAYWAVFAGAFGHTYGHRSFIAWTRLNERNRWGAYIPWFDALDTPGARQMRHLNQLMTSLAFFSRIPDQSVIVGDTGAGVNHARATRDAEGSYILVYLPTGRPTDINLETLNGPRAAVTWFNPRDGSRQAVEPVATREIHRFRPPTSGDGQDWVLMLQSIPASLTTTTSS
ncbi:glycoside hydrolase family 140 protein [Desulfosarcina sp.]|uniref:glycoside hydrolase family 140 protein n=1 Tax=Desulfosarcina sp. TaxID=2027861 RepID=UPI0039709385